MKKITMLCLLMTSLFSVSAQKYKAAALYEAKGPVKEIIYDEIQPGQYEEVLKFKKDGRQKYRWFFRYAPDGKVYGDSMLTHRFSEMFDFSYDSEGRLERVGYAYIKNEKRDSTFIDNTYEIKYDEKGLRSSVRLVQKDRQGKIVIDNLTIFADYIFDDKGNWISRTMQFRPALLPEGKTLPKEKILQKRTIKYYRTSSATY